MVVFEQKDVPTGEQIILPPAEKGPVGELGPAAEPLRRGTVNLDVEAGVGAVVTKGSTSDTPGQKIEIPNTPLKHEPWAVILQAFPQGAKETIEKLCAERKVDVGSFLTQQVVGMLHIYRHRMCPFCAPGKIERLQKKLSVIDEVREQVRRENKSRKDKRKAAKDARRRNRNS